MQLYVIAALVVVVVGFVAFVYMTGRRSGATAVERKVEGESREALERIDAARANAPKDQAGTVDRLKSGRF